MRFHWHYRYLELAQTVARWSKHPKFKVGAVAIDPKFGQILSTGYNGWPRGIEGEEAYHAENELALSLSIHAEANVIYNASLTGVSLRGSTLYVSQMLPCLECAKAIVQVGMEQVCYLNSVAANLLPDSAEAQARWGDSWDYAQQLFKEAGIIVTRVEPV